MGLASSRRGKEERKKRKEELQWSFANCRRWTAVKIVNPSDRYIPKLPKIGITFTFHPLHTNISHSTGTVLPVKKVKRNLLQWPQTQLLT